MVGLYIMCQLYSSVTDRILFSSLDANRFNVNGAN